MTGSSRPTRRRLPTHPGTVLRDDVLPALHRTVGEAARLAQQRLEEELEKIPAHG